MPNTDINDEWLRAVIGTLVHHGTFRAHEITEHTFDRRPLDGPAIVRKLLRRGLIERLEDRAFYPTSAGWNWLKNTQDEPDEPSIGGPPL